MACVGDTRPQPQQHTSCEPNEHLDVATGNCVAGAAPPDTPCAANEQRDAAGSYVIVSNPGGQVAPVAAVSCPEGGQPNAAGGCVQADGTVKCRLGTHADREFFSGNDLFRWWWEDWAGLGLTSK